MLVSRLSVLARLRWWRRNAPAGSRAAALEALRDAERDNERIRHAPERNSSTSIQNYLPLDPF